MKALRILFKSLGVALVLSALVQFSTPAMAQTYIRRYAVHLTANGTTTVVSGTVYVSAVVICVSSAGASSNTFTIRNKEGTPKNLYTATNIAVGTYSPVSLRQNEAMVMTSGIDIVIATGTAPTADVFITYYK